MPTLLPSAGTETQNSFVEMNSTAQALLIVLCHIANIISSRKCPQVTANANDWNAASTENRSIVASYETNNISSTWSSELDTGPNENVTFEIENNYTNLNSGMVTEPSSEANFTESVSQLNITVFNSQYDFKNNEDACNNVSYEDIIESINSRYADLLYHIYGEISLEDLLRAQFSFENTTELVDTDNLTITGNCTEAISYVEKQHGDWKKEMQKIHEFQIIKAVVLAVVIIVILASTCKMVFQLFVQFQDPSKAEK